MLTLCRPWTPHRRPQGRVDNFRCAVRLSGCHPHAVSIPQCGSCEAEAGNCCEYHGERKVREIGEHNNLHTMFPGCSGTRFG